MKKNYLAQNVNEAKDEKYWSNIKKHTWNKTKQKQHKQNKWDFHVQIQHSKLWQANTPTVTTTKRIDTTRMSVKYIREEANRKKNTPKSQKVLESFFR